MRLTIVLFALICCPLTAQAESFQKRCPDIASCARAVAELTGDKYIFTKETVGTTESTPNLDLTPQNAEMLFTHMLFVNGFTRVPLSEPKTFAIRSQREALDGILPRFEGALNRQISFPDHWDLGTLIYHAGHPEVLEQMARHLRSLMPANARVIANELSKTLLLTASNPDLKRLYPMIQEMDQKPSAALLKRWEEQAKKTNEKNRLRDVMIPPGLPDPMDPAERAKRMNVPPVRVDGNR